VVEDQHVVATRKLVDSNAEQALLEDLLESAKPPWPREVHEPFRPGLHYLLTTPFRYPPLRHGSRFGRRHERGIWYGAENLSTAFAETAYYRLVFSAGTTADLEPVRVDLSTFRAPVRTEHGIDLTLGCFAEHAEEISSPTRYQESQRLGSDLRAAGVYAFRFRSARDPAGGANVGVFDPAAFAALRPASLATWHCTVSPSRVEFRRRDVLSRGDSWESHGFDRQVFEVDGVLPAPAV
jgi:hypothetical protein